MLVICDLIVIVMPSSLCCGELIGLIAGLAQHQQSIWGGGEVAVVSGARGEVSQSAILSQ